MYVYRRDKKSIGEWWEVGFYLRLFLHPSEEIEWIPESGHNTQEAAARRVNYLNGGTGSPPSNATA